MLQLRMGFPQGHRKTTTLVAGLRMTGMIAPMVLDGPINGEWFEADVRQVLVPELRPGDIVVMDTLSRLKCSTVREVIEGQERRCCSGACWHESALSDHGAMLTVPGGD